MTQKEEQRQSLIYELSKIENKHTGEYAIAEEPLSWQNSGAIADYILENFVSKDEILKAIQSMHEYSLSDIELLEHQTKTEHPMISKTKLIKALGIGEIE